MSSSRRSSAVAVALVALAWLLSGCRDEWPAHVASPVSRAADGSADELAAEHRAKAAWVAAQVEARRVAGEQSAAAEAPRVAAEQSAAEAEAQAAADAAAQDFAGGTATSGGRPTPGSPTRATAAPAPAPAAAPDAQPVDSWVHLDISDCSFDGTQYHYTLTVIFSDGYRESGLRGSSTRPAMYNLYMDHGGRSSFTVYPEDQEWPC